VRVLSAASDHAPALVQPGTIVLVDDEPLLLRAFTRVLERRPENIETYVTARAAVARVARGGVDVVVSDVSMPGMSGIELMRAIHEYDGDLPVVLLTGHVTLETKDDAARSEVFEHMVKPVCSEALRSTVDRAIEQHRLMRLNRENPNPWDDVYVSGTHRTSMRSRAIAGRKEEPMAIERAGEDDLPDIRVGEDLDTLFTRAREYDRLLAGKNLNGNDLKKIGRILRNANRMLAAGLDEVVCG
jgi:CheY-like chemotaxis protein